MDINNDGLYPLWTNTSPGFIINDSFRTCIIASNFCKRERSLYPTSHTVCDVSTSINVEEEEKGKEREAQTEASKDDEEVEV